jgi:hypothetical protein
VVKRHRVVDRPRRLAGTRQAVGFTRGCHHGPN